MSLNNKTIYREAYHLLKYFSHYVLPGAKRLGVTGEADDVLAFKNENNNIVVVAHNQIKEDITRQIKINEDVLSFTLKPESFNTIVVKSK